MNVFVTGGTGYVGNRIVDSLLHDGHQVTLLQRPGTTRPTPYDVKIVHGDLFSSQTLTRGLAGADAVVHLVGIIRERKRQGITMQRIHVEGTKRIVEAATASNVPRILHMSALGARLNAVSAYHKSKWEAEGIVRTSGLQYTIFRPSVVYGKGGPGPEFLGQLTDLVRSAPVTPVIGDGHFLLQPISVETVAAAFVNALDRPEAIGKTYELGGHDTVSYRKILELIASRQNKSLRAVRIPVWMMKALVNAFGRFPWFPLTKDQLTMLLEGNVCDDSQRAVEELQIAPKPFAL
ncbi:complex I NDUFA9 subunit family protein [Alicyclobacillus sp. SO9]|uniref:complex I NDUFA9 subunit family protein n=1 Tax=Alicyclobacillus sp. SO9 TaxID=2665646 RepID=UPI0018E7B783|nr:complex I NDUFA9 subunit family protein [Alicyclobacillus sp. SO9]QQE76766.1 complex I NDUFA9 subunit family protein [Alicyclobacillus sp. SO9]